MDTLVDSRIKRFIEPLVGAVKSSINIAGVINNGNVGKFIEPLNNLAEGTEIYTREKNPEQKVINELAFPLTEEHVPTATTTKGVVLRQIPQQWKKHINDAYIRYPGLQKYEGLLEAIMMQESSMGTIDTNYNPDIGESAWLAGFTDIAKEDIGGADLNTQKGVIDAMARFLDKKRIVVNEDGSQTEYKDPVNLYLQRYKTKEGKKLTPEQIKRFREYVNYYKMKES